ncbi:hypothetical protein HF072_03920 [Bacillus sp. RO3]|nr:hypothetical protein [Bacillus sp. RO3]
MELRCSRDELKGHTLRLIVTRIDFHDIFEIDELTLKQINTLLKSYGLKSNEPVQLSEEDFFFNDPLNFTHLPIDYITDVKSQIFYIDDDLTLEVNQLFLRLVQTVENRNYRNYSSIEEIVSNTFNILKEREGVRIRRTSIKKVNEVFFIDLDDLRSYFKEDVINLNQYSGHINWSLPKSKSRLIQNFRLNDCLVNFVRVFDNGMMNNEPVFRLYTEFETYFYFQNSVDEEMENLLTILNDNIFILFEGSLNDKAIEKLKSSDEGIGDY